MGWQPGARLTMISMPLQREVPQYMAMPWLMTCVMARTISVGTKSMVSPWAGWPLLPQVYKQMQYFVTQKRLDWST